jgi:hypothetical protein
MEVELVAACGSRGSGCLHLYQDQTATGDRRAAALCQCSALFSYTRTSVRSVADVPDAIANIIELSSRLQFTLKDSSRPLSHWQVCRANFYQRRSLIMSRFCRRNVQEMEVNRFSERSPQFAADDNSSVSARAVNIQNHYGLQ